MSTTNRTAPMPKTATPALISIYEASRMLYMSTSEVMDLCDTRAIPSAYVGEVRLVRPADVHAFAAELVAV